MSNDELYKELNPIHRLLCCCCGGVTRGRQWSNRDTGYGMCGDCIKWVQGRGMPASEIHSLYGIEGTHYNVKE